MKTEQQITERTFDNSAPVAILKENKFFEYYGFETIEITKEQIMELLNNKILISHAGEYVVLIRLKK